MPYENIDLGRSISWKGGDFFETSACASFSATPLQVVPSGGAGFTTFISSILVSSPSAQCIKMWDGASAVHARVYTKALDNTLVTWPRGMELETTTNGSNLKFLSDTSATTYFTIAGFYQETV